MKKFLFSFLMLIAAVSLWAYDFKVDGIYYNIIDEGNWYVEVQGWDYHYSNSSLGIVEEHCTTVYKVQEAFSSLNLPDGNVYKEAISRTLYPERYSE